MRSFLLRSLWAGGGIAIGLLLWSLLSLAGGSDKVSSPLRVSRRLLASAWSDPILSSQLGHTQGLLTSTFVTGESFFGAFAAAIAITLLLVSVLWFAHAPMKFAELAVRPISYVPPLVLIPFILGRLQDSTGAVFWTVFAYTGILLLGQAVVALETIPRAYLELGESVCRGRGAFFRQVIVPAAFPSFLRATKVISSIGIGVAIVAEYLTAPAGLGGAVKMAMSYSDVDLVVSCIILAIACHSLWSFCVNLVLRHVKGYLAKPYPAILEH